MNDTSSVISSYAYDAMGRRTEQHGQHLFYSAGTWNVVVGPSGQVSIGGTGIGVGGGLVFGRGGLEGAQAAGTIGLPGGGTIGGQIGTNGPPSGSGGILWDPQKPGGGWGFGGLGGGLIWK